jgi:hypothetical protein
MALELKPGGVLIHVRHAIFFYGHPPTLFQTDGKFPDWTLHCEDPRERGRFEELLSAEVTQRYDLDGVALVHVHGPADVRRALGRSKGKVWDVVGWVGHGSHPLKGVAGALLPTLDAQAVSQDQAQPGEMDAKTFATAVSSALAQAPREFIVVGCDASDNGFGPDLSREFPRSTVTAGTGTSKVAVQLFGRDNDHLSLYGKARVEIEGETLRYKNGDLAKGDASIAAQVRRGLSDPANPFDRGRLSESKISVSASGGIVTLSGSVAKEVSRVVAIAIAKGVPGVTTVKDDLRLVVGGGLVGSGM